MATLKSFPKALYKGDSINVTFQIKDKNTNEIYELVPGDKIFVGIKQNLDDTQYQIYKELTITSPGDRVMVEFTPEETNQLSVVEEKAILEARLEYNNGASRATVFQENIRLEGVVIDE